MSHRCPTCGYGCQTFSDQSRHRCELVLKEKLRIATDALKWYADNSNYYKIDTPIDDSGEFDYGYMARHTLEDIA